PRFTPRKRTRRRTEADIAAEIQKLKRPPTEPPKRKKPQQGAGGLGLGLLIFEKQTHPGTGDVTAVGELRSFNERGRQVRRPLRNRSVARFALYVPRVASSWREVDRTAG